MMDNFVIRYGTELLLWLFTIVAKSCYKISSQFG